jgi:hypothetical protein
VADIVFIYEGEESAPQNETANVLIWSQPRLMDELEIRLVPYGVMTDERATVVAAGMVSNASQLESLLEYARRVEPEERSDFEERRNHSLKEEMRSDATTTR